MPTTPDPDHDDTYWQRAVADGMHVRCNYANNVDYPHASGHVIAYYDQPTVLVRDQDGNKTHWAAGLTVPDPSVPDKPGGAQPSLTRAQHVKSFQDGDVQKRIVLWLQRSFPRDPQVLNALAYLVANTPPVDIRISQDAIDAIEELKALGYVEDAPTSHTVQDVDPGGWIDVVAVRSGKYPIKTALIGRHLTIDRARRLAAELLSAAARADAEQDTGQRVQDASNSDQDITDTVLVNLLGLVCVTVTPDLVASWTPGQRQDAAQWASCVHLSASDNDVDVPERPAFLPGGDQDTAQDGEPTRG